LVHLAVVATALVAVACVEDSTQPESELANPRIKLLNQAYAKRRSDPAGAVRLLERTGAGAVLEQARLDLWLDCLKRSKADAQAWQRLVDARPPTGLLQQALIGLGRALISEKQVTAGVTTLEAAACVEADEALLSCPLPEAQRRAAERLARSHPHRLRRRSLTLEKHVLAGLSNEAWLTRSAAWRRLGATGQVIAELGDQTWLGDAERKRRVELGRAYVEHGSSRRALRLLSHTGGGEELLVRAMAFRNQGWQRFPRASAEAPFRSCLTAASRAAADLDHNQPLLHEALRLVVECGTESGAVEDALDAWWRLAADGWLHQRRDWFGRRLGVVVSQDARTRTALPSLASSLPDHARCLRYWSSKETDSSRQILAELADSAIGDLYSQWAREDLGRSAPARLRLPPPAGTAQPPQTVRWLQEWGAETQASQHWRRLRSRRGSSPAEALAAAGFEHDRGRADLAIRCLRASCPELGTVAMEEAPVDIVHAYLPLQWRTSLQEAAREVGLPPWLVAGVARQESLFVATARSPRGAIGVLQLIPSTARIYSVPLGLGARPDLTDPAVNIRIGTRFLASLIAELGAVEPALAAYNAGATRSRRWWRRWPNRRQFTEAIPIYETYTYVRRVTYLAEAYRLVYQDQWEAKP
jgi:soluble lytic murein transglycosylase